MEQTEPNDPDDPQGPQIPDDPNPPMTGYIAHTMTEGELMYYGHDSEYSKEGGAVYFLYLKDLNNSARGCSVCFYVNVPRQEKGSFTLPAGKYTASSTWEINTFNNKNTTRYRSNWNVVAPKWTQYVAEAGEFEVAIGDNMTYTIRGHMKGGSIQDGGSIMENEAGVAFAFTGRLLISDYSEDYEDPDDPDTPDDPAPEVPEVTMSTGSLYRYNDNIYYLQLKDANPADLYETTFYLKLPASDSPLLASGDYPVSTGSGEMTLDAAKSSWTFIDKENFNDRIKNTIKEGSLTVTNNGNHNYTVTGTLRGASDTGQETAIKIDFTGTVPFNNYSTPPAPEAPKATMTVGDLYYNGDNVFFLGLKDGSPIKEYGITFYITLAPTDPLQLASGDYTGGAAGENMTFDLAKSFWNYNDPTYGIIKNRITEETLKIVANGNDDYTITGSFKAIDEDDKNTELEIEYTGKLPCEDYSY